ncbi:hypothetical protein M3J09_011745 [Ascochyta lentis]
MSPRCCLVPDRRRIALFDLHHRASLPFPIQTHSCLLSITHNCTVYIVSPRQGEVSVLSGIKPCIVQKGN